MNGRDAEWWRNYRLARKWKKGVDYLVIKAATDPLPDPLGDGGDES